MNGLCKISEFNENSRSREFLGISLLFPRLTMKNDFLFLNLVSKHENEKKEIILARIVFFSILVLVSKSEIKNNESRSRLDAWDWRNFFSVSPQSLRLSARISRCARLNRRNSHSRHEFEKNASYWPLQYMYVCLCVHTHSAVTNRICPPSFPVSARRESWYIGGAIHQPPPSHRHTPQPHPHTPAPHHSWASLKLQCVLTFALRFRFVELRLKLEQRLSPPYRSWWEKIGY